MNSGFIEKLISRLDRVEPGKVERTLLNLLREKGFLEQVFEALQEGVIILDPDGTITFVNQSAGRFFGLSHESIGKSIGSQIRGFDWDKLTQNQSTLTRDLEVFYPENRFLNFYLSPIDDEEGSNQQKIGWVMLIRDITESRAEAAQTIEQEKLSALTLLAAGVAHEIGNPLNSLNIHLQLLRRKIGKLPSNDQNKLLEHLDTATNEVERLDHILKDFLQAIRPTQPQRKAEDLNALLNQTLQTLEPELEAANVTVHLKLAPSLFPLSLDGTQIQQALYNLIRNAQQALPANKGEITIRTQQNEMETLITIIDNGTGIPPEIMGTLYEPYQSTKESGTGLGLLIVRRIIREHGGHLDIQSSQSESDHGTTVKLSFPRNDQRVQLLSNPADPTIEI